jgi:apolipoprotein N-acyltransferase
MPRQVPLDTRARALVWVEAHRPKPRNWIAAALIVVLWVAGLWALWLCWLRARLLPG